ncbi:hypothetical protein COW95_02940 [Candidatus Peregrinibacteria bacterium CG22_combo_CG10-13_8_21_14_all_49_11]|nr:MAG: hypothetical protein COW95_02940 [Candidatus Peregrinibacteria bacterium CG22_combo_CG10-13_8_21_14_all_49_11]
MKLWQVKGNKFTMDAMHMPTHCDKLMNIVNRTENTSALSDAFQHARPFPHVVMENFLEEEFCQQLLEEFPSFKKERAIDENGNVGRKAVCTSVRSLGAAFRTLDEMIQSQEFLGMLSRITGISDLLYDPEYFGGGTHENLHGQNMDTHIDFNMHPRYHWHRRLNLLLFLNRDWQPEWGGNFRLFADPDTPDPTDPSVTPCFNRAAMFATSEYSWHGFDPIHLPKHEQSRSRKSIALYFYTQEPPQASGIRPRSTIYKDTALPEHLQPGYVLTKSDVRCIHDLYQRRGAHITRLYEHEKHFYERMQTLEQELRTLKTQHNLLCPLEGPVTLYDSPTGLWDDHWVAETFLCPLAVQTFLSNMHIHGSIPDFFPHARTVTVDVHGQRHIVRLGKGSFIQQIPLHISEGQYLLRITCDTTFNPRDAGHSQDTRNLAWLLGKLSFS